MIPGRYAYDLSTATYGQSSQARKEVLGAFLLRGASRKELRSSKGEIARGHTGKLSQAHLKRAACMGIRLFIRVGEVLTGPAIACSDHLVAVPQDEGSETAPRTPRLGHCIQLLAGGSCRKIFDLLRADDNAQVARGPGIRSSQGK